VQTDISKTGNLKKVGILKATSGEKDQMAGWKLKELCYLLLFNTKGQEAVAERKQ